MDYLFSKPDFNCLGDAYVDPPMNPHEHGVFKGRRQFQTSPPKKGRTANTVWRVHKTPVVAELICPVFSSEARTDRRRTLKLRGVVPAW